MTVSVTIAMVCYPLLFLHYPHNSKVNMERKSPDGRQRYVPCHCDVHAGSLVHYKTRQRCARLSFEIEQRLVHAPRAYTSDESSGHSTDSDLLDRMSYFHVDDEIDSLCLALFVNHVDNKTTEDCVTNNLQTIKTNLGRFLPDHLHAKVPSTFKQLRSMFLPFMMRLIRLPVCPGECRILDDVRPTLNYKCWCNGETNHGWR